MCVHRYWARHLLVSLWCLLVFFTYLGSIVGSLFLSIGEFIFKKAQLFPFDHTMFEFSYTRFGRIYFSMLNIYYSLFVYFFFCICLCLKKINKSQWKIQKSFKIMCTYMNVSNIDRSKTSSWILCENNNEKGLFLFLSRIATRRGKASCIVFSWDEIDSMAQEVRDENAL